MSEPDDNGPVFDEVLQGTDDLEALAARDVRLTLELLPDGRMRAPEQETRDLLRDRLRHAELLPTGPGWAVLRTIGPTEAHDDAQQREVVVAGVISEAGLSVIDFIGFLASAYQTGVVTAASGDIERSVFFHNGDVVWAASTASQDRLGSLLVERGKITTEQLDTVMAETGGRRIGQRCVERGYLSAHDLWTMVQAQLREIFDRLITMESGLWSFSRVSEAILADSQIHLSTQGLLVDALRRLDELNVYRQRIRSSEVTVQKVVATPEETAAGIARLDPDVRDDAASVLNALAVPTPVKKLMGTLGRSEFEATRIVYQLLRANLVDVVTQETGPIPRRAPVTTTEAREVIDVYSLALREMFDDVARVQMGPALRKAARDFLLDDASRNFSTFYRTVQIRADGTIDATPVLVALGPDGLDAQELSDALSELMFFILFQATEILGRRRGDNLARRVKMIHAMLATGPRGPDSS